MTEQVEPKERQNSEKSLGEICFEALMQPKESAWSKMSNISRHTWEKTAEAVAQEAITRYLVAATPIPDPAKQIDGFFGDGLVRPSEPHVPKLCEPTPQQEMLQREIARRHNYKRSCKKCSMPIHDKNTSEYCSSCYDPKAATV